MSPRLLFLLSTSRAGQSFARMSDRNDARLAAIHLPVGPWQNRTLAIVAT